MTDREHELVTLLKTMRYDLTALQGKVSEALRQAALLEPGDPGAHRCPDCGITCRGPLSLQEHAYHQHNAPVPDHWQHAEAAAAPEPAP
jgi:hypothetical protein